MDERERMKRRREALSSVNRRKRNTEREGTGGKELFWFRTYVTVIIVGATLMVSFFHTESTEKMTMGLRQAIAYQMPADSFKKMGHRAMAVFQKADTSFDEMKKRKQDQSLDDKTEQKGGTERDTESIGEFEPDLGEDDGEIP